MKQNRTTPFTATAEGWFATKPQEPIALIVAIVALAIAITMHYTSKRMKHNQFTVFDREKGAVTFPKGMFQKGVLEGPWEDWSARLGVQSTSVGAAWVLNHGLHEEREKG